MLERISRGLGWGWAALVMGVSALAGFEENQDPKVEEVGRGLVPELYLTDAQLVLVTKLRYEAGDKEVGKRVAELVAQAEKALELPLMSVVDKPQAPASGDKHDYLSLSPYWWPDPAKPDGLPYVWRDGEVNPERWDYDVTRLEKTCYAVRDLGVAYFFTGDERLAENAAARLRRFFLAEETRMNPNLNYAQTRRGHTYLVYSGMIEASRFRWMLEAAQFLRRSPHWTEAEHAALRRWFRDLAEWFVVSPTGQQERASPNNHGTWWAAHVAYFALFAGDRELAQSVYPEVRLRVFSQFEPDGKQPQELKRTRGLHYSIYNLRGMLDLAWMGRTLDRNILDFQSDKGQTIRKGIQFLLPYLQGEPWPYEQISPWEGDAAGEMLRRAAMLYGDASYEAILQAGGASLEPDRLVGLLLPNPLMEDSGKK